MFILLDRETFESALIQMAVPDGRVRVFPTLGVRQRQPLHERGQLAVLLRPEDQVPMIGHNAPVENADGHSAMRKEQHTFEREEIIVFFEQPQAAVGSIQDVIDQSAGGVSERFAACDG